MEELAQIADEIVAGFDVQLVDMTTFEHFDNSIAAGLELPNLKILSVAPLLGEAIRRIHCHESVSRLFSDMQLWSGK